MISIAGAILVSNSGTFLLQRRDDNTASASPNMISIFGGATEAVDENPLAAAMQEVEEETGISLPAEAYLQLVQFKNSYPDGRIINASIYVLENIEKGELQITEGTLIEIPISEIGRYMDELVPTTCFAISVYLQKWGSQKI